MTAGEAAFLLPFVLPRIFRPALLDVFGLTNFELGTAFSVYGVVAVGAYFFGGPLADRFNARRLLVIALLTTAVAGLVLLTEPALRTLVLLYAWWGVSTIALFWSPLIRTTREWGAEHQQGAAFGLLDGGRGLLAAVTASAMVVLFGWLMPPVGGEAQPGELAAALRAVILLLIGITIAAALLTWWALPDNRRTGNTDEQGFDPHVLPQLLRRPTLWLQAIIILCAYVGFKSTDDFALYAHEVLGFDDVDAASVGALSIWIRPIAAIGAGLLADRFGANRMTLLSFTLLAAGSCVLASGLFDDALATLFIATIIGTSLGIFALRGLYFAVMQESRVPLAYTGTAVGLVSVIGYTPDVFMGPLMGFLLDRSPGAAGHQDFFWLICAFAVAGLLATGLFSRLTRSSAG